MKLAHRLSWMWIVFLCGCSGHVLINDTNQSQVYQSESSIELNQGYFRIESQYVPLGRALTENPELATVPGGRKPFEQYCQDRFFKVIDEREQGIVVAKPYITESTLGRKELVSEEVVIFAYDLATCSKTGARVDISPHAKFVGTPRVDIKFTGRSKLELDYGSIATSIRYGAQLGGLIWLGQPVDLDRSAVEGAVEAGGEKVAKVFEDYQEDSWTATFDLTEDAELSRIYYPVRYKRGGPDDVEADVSEYDVIGFLAISIQTAPSIMRGARMHEGRLDLSEASITGLIDSLEGETKGTVQELQSDLEGIPNDGIEESCTLVNDDIDNIFRQSLTSYDLAFLKWKVLSENHFISLLELDDSLPQDEGRGLIPILIRDVGIEVLTSNVGRNVAELDARQRALENGIQELSRMRSLWTNRCFVAISQELREVGFQFVSEEDIRGAIAELNEENRRLEMWVDAIGHEPTLEYAAPSYDNNAISKLKELHRIVREPDVRRRMNHIASRYLDSQRQRICLDNRTEFYVLSFPEGCGDVVDFAIAVEAIRGNGFDNMGCFLDLRATENPASERTLREVLGYEYFHAMALLRLDQSESSIPVVAMLISFDYYRLSDDEPADVKMVLIDGEEAIDRLGNYFPETETCRNITPGISTDRVAMD